MLFAAVYESGNGPKRTYTIPAAMSAVGGRADIIGLDANLCF